MARIEGFRVKNYRTLKDVTLGKLWNTRGRKPLTPMTVIIGHNGVGKSTLFDAFGFISDCLRFGLEEAADMKDRGGFERMRSQGSTAPIEFEFYYRKDTSSRPITYELSIDQDEHGRIYVKSERLRQRRHGQRHGWPYSFLHLNEGRGFVWCGERSGQLIDDGLAGLPLEELLKKLPDEGEESSERDQVELRDKQRLGINTLGALKQHPRIAAFRDFIESWHLSYFTPDAARSLPRAGAQRHLNVHGDNLGNVVQFMQREAPDRFSQVLKRIAGKIPGIDKISVSVSEDKRLLLKFNDSGFKDPFFAQQVSNGTLKMFAYLLLLEDPFPSPFICIEEPENGLYHKLLEGLAAELRAHAAKPRNKGSAQVFITTHQPYFVDALLPEEVWVLKKGPDGFAEVQRASDDPTVKALAEEGLPLGGLWYSDYLDGR
ncbi:AAA family ATPase [Myxococcota bacterium]|nr:AAA family ATPase [Myxococcota bacterium]